MTCDGFWPLPDAVAALPELPHWWTEPSAWFWIGLSLALITFELWAWIKHRRSPSQITQSRSKASRWFRAIGLTIWALLGFHLFFDVEHS